MKGFSEVTIQNRPCSIVYRGEHYAIRYLSGRAVRMAKAEIIRKFHLHHDALDRYVAGGFKKTHCNANEDIVRVNRSLWYVENVAFFVTTRDYSRVRHASRGFGKEIRFCVRCRT